MDFGAFHATCYCRYRRCRFEHQSPSRTAAGGPELSKSKRAIGMLAIGWIMVGPSAGRDSKGRAIACAWVDGHYNGVIKLVAEASGKRESRLWISVVAEVCCQRELRNPGVAI